MAGPVEIRRSGVVLDLQVSPEEVKSMEVSWTLTKKLDFQLRVQSRSGGAVWCWTFKLAQKRSKAWR